ncbi:MAG: hydrogen peroxide-inducible genes activator [Bryobacter sp.]|nr:hydrogen peroxide-inducible genes activator [Bryobacter sp.]
MDVLQLRYFLAVARAGSFVKAAEEERIAQPSLSQQIKKLEESLGVSLFDRLGRGLKLSPYGEYLLPEAEAILAKVEGARRGLEALRSVDAGQVKVGIIPTLLPYAMVEPLAAFQKKHPAIELVLVEDQTETLIQHLRRAELDVALLALPIKQEEIVCSELFREPLFAAVPPGHKLAQETRIQLSSLSPERMLLLREGHCLRDDVLTACNKSKSQFHHFFESDHLESILRMVGAGFGVSLVPAKAAAGRTDATFLPFEPKAVRRIGYALVPAHTALPARSTFVKFLKQWNWD